MHNCLTRPTSWGHFKGTFARKYSNKFGIFLAYSYLCKQNEKDKDNRDEALDDRRVS